MAWPRFVVPATALPHSGVRQRRFPDAVDSDTRTDRPPGLGIPISGEHAPRHRGGAGCGRPICRVRRPDHRRRRAGRAPRFRRPAHRRRRRRHPVVVPRAGAHPPLRGDRAARSGLRGRASAHASGHGRAARGVARRDPVRRAQAGQRAVLRRRRRHGYGARRARADTRSRGADLLRRARGADRSQAGRERCRLVHLPLRRGHPATGAEGRVVPGPGWSRSREATG